MSVNPIPDGYTAVTPYLHVRSAADAIAFYQKAFGATELTRMAMPDGSIGHAEIDIHGARVMMADENPRWGSKSPATLGGTTGGYCLYVTDCDAVFAQAVAAGATVKMAVTDQFYGDRSGCVIDPFGHQWTIATHTEDLTPDQLQERMDAWARAKSAA